MNGGATWDPVSIIRAQPTDPLYGKQSMCLCDWIVTQFSRRAVNIGSGRLFGIVSKSGVKNRSSQRLWQDVPWCYLDGFSEYIIRDIMSFDMHMPAGWLTLRLQYTPNIVWVYVSLGMQDGVIGHLTLLHRIFLWPVMTVLPLTCGCSWFWQCTKHQLLTWYQLCELVWWLIKHSLEPNHWSCHIQGRCIRGWVKWKP
jgi:hypothetical protein